MSWVIRLAGTLDLMSSLAYWIVDKAFSAALIAVHRSGNTKIAGRFMQSKRKRLLLQARFGRKPVPAASSVSLKSPGNVCESSGVTVSVRLIIVWPKNL